MRGRRPEHRLTVEMLRRTGFRRLVGDGVSPTTARAEFVYNNIMNRLDRAEGLLMTLPGKGNHPIGGRCSGYRAVKGKCDPSGKMKPSQLTHRSKINRNWHC